MKKIISTIACGLILAAGVSVEASGTLRSGYRPPVKFGRRPMVSNNLSAIKGDVNGDGKVTVTDLSLMKSYIVGTLNSSSRFIERNADINGDGKITLTDLSLLKQILVEGENPSVKEETAKRYVDVYVNSSLTQRYPNRWIDKGEKYKVVQDYGNSLYVQYYSSSGQVREGYVSSKIKEEAILCYPVDNPGFEYNQWGVYYSENGKYHVALDLYSRNEPKGTDKQISVPIKAIADGILVSSGWQNANGNYIVIKHNIAGKECYSFYAHLNTRNVQSSGQPIQMGQTIGYLGKTGSAAHNIYHLHFSIVNTVMNGGYLGYLPNKVVGNTAWDSKNNVKFYNPRYVLDYGRLPD